VLIVDKAATAKSGHVVIAVIDGEMICKQVERAARLPASGGAFSIITTAASTIAPMAMAMPPIDMMLALGPFCCMTSKAAITPTGSEMIATRADLRCHRTHRQPSAGTW